MNKWVPGWQPLRMAALGLMAFGAATAALAQARIESISSSIQGGADVVRIDFDQPLAAVPAGFVVQSPARIALDFPGWSVALRAATSRSTRATCGPPTWRRAVIARAWCST